jgi:hypothetical protein
MDDDFTPSIPTSTAAHVPAGYPTSRLSVMAPATVFGEADDMSAVESDSSDDDYTNDSDTSSSGDDTNSGNDSDDDEPRAESNEQDDSPARHPDRLDPVPTCTLDVQPPPPLPIEHQPSVLAALAAPIPPTTFYETHSHRSSCNSLTINLSSTQLSTTISPQKQIAKLMAQNEQLLSRIKFFKAHCAMAVSEIHDLKRRMNAREARGRKKKKLNVNAHCLTSKEGMQLCEEWDAAERLKA